MTVVVHSGSGLQVDEDGDAARGEEAVVPLADGGLDVMGLLGGVDVGGGGPDAVEVGFGVALGRGLGAGVVAVVVAACPLAPGGLEMVVVVMASARSLRSMTCSFDVAEWWGIR